MSNVPSHAVPFYRQHVARFYRQVAKGCKVWTIRDSGGFPAPKNSEGIRVKPFWSSLRRVEKIIATVPAYAPFKPYEISWDTFRDRWIPGLKKDGQLVGVNWSGPRATGYDVDPESVREAIEFQIQHQLQA